MQISGNIRLAIAPTDSIVHGWVWLLSFVTLLYFIVLQFNLKGKVGCWLFPKSLLKDSPH